MSAIARMLDANVNRAREALRVMEDAARFALDDAAISAEVKSLRHDLRSALDALPEGWLEANRDTPGDIGTGISDEREMSRGDLSDVVIAAGKRLTEALRVIEEMSKTVDAGLGGEIEALRYRAYDVDQRLTLRLGSGHARQWRLCLLLTQSLCLRPWREVLTAAIDGGVDCVQVREKDMQDGELAEHAREVIEIVGVTALRDAERRATVIVNDRADVALAVGADGVHVGQDDLSVRDVRRIAGRTLIVGASTHDLNEAKRAVEAGADYCGVGAMFESSTKQREASGIAYLRTFIEGCPHIPHLAIGGVTENNVSQLVEAGARGVAVSSAICGAADPGAVARQIIGALRSVSAAGPPPSSLECGPAARMAPSPRSSGAAST